MHIDPLYENARARHEERLERSLAAYRVRTPSVRDHGGLNRTVRLFGRLLRHEGKATNAPAGTGF
jgi:hypothetical protein